MALTKEQLIAFGIADEQATKVLELHRQVIDGNYIPKDKFNAEREKVQTLTTQLSERDAQISELKTFKGTAAELQSKVTTLEQRNSDTINEYNKKIARLELDSVIRSVVSPISVDVDDVMGKLDYDKIKLVDGKAEGLDVQVDALKVSKPHYFKSAESGFGGFFGKTPPGSGGNAGGGNGGSNKGADFGKQLAEEVANRSKAVNSDYYFK